jgi:hypothetical protein
MGIIKRIADNKWKATTLLLMAAWCSLYAIRPAWALKPLSTIGVNFPTQTGSPCAANTACLYVKSTDSNKLHYIDPSNSDIALGAGGGGGTTQTIDVINATAATAKTITSAAADSATNIGITFNNSTTLTTPRRLASFQNNGTELLSLTPYTGGGIKFLSGASNNGFGVYGDTTYQTDVIFNGNVYYNILYNQFRSNSDNAAFNGTSAARWFGTYSYWYDNKIGAQLTAAGTITPTASVHHVTGATTINIIATTNVPSSGNVFFTIIADSTVNIGSSASAGGIKTAATAITSGKAMTFILDQGTSLWYPVQGA